MARENLTALQRMLDPQSIALLGVSSSGGSLAEIVLQNLERFGYAGQVHLVHPRQRELLGRRCLASATELPWRVDCAVLAIAADAVLPAVEACAARGVGGVVVFSAGFAELGAAGLALQERIGAVARRAGMALAGPNCLGFVNYAAGIPLTFAIVEPRRPAHPAVAIVSQSGALASALRASLHGRALAVSAYFSTGNEAVNGLEDFIEYALDLPDTQVLALICEHVRQPRRFLALAGEARRRGKTLVLLHPGRSAAAHRTSQTHTGSLAGSHAAMRAQVTGHGVLWTDTLEQLIDVTECLLRCCTSPAASSARRGTAVLCESGSFKALALDYCEALGLPLPQPQGSRARALDALAPGFIVASNPLDVTAQALNEPELYDRALEELADGCGSILIVVLLTSAGMAKRKMPALLGVLQRWVATHPVLFAMLGEDTPLPQEVVESVRDCGVPFFPSPERAMRALTVFGQIGSSHSASPPVAVAVAMPAARFAPGVVSEHAAKDALAAAGIDVAPHRLAHSREAAVAAAAALGFPVAMKIQSIALLHKSDAGGVMLGVADAAELAVRWDELFANVKRNAPDAVLEGVLIERMAPQGLEFLVGGRNDPDWGATVAVGLGGVLTEALDDVIVMPAGSSAQSIHSAMWRLRGAKLLASFRGAPARDVAALSSFVEQLGSFLLAHPEIAELDINPLIVLEAGRGVVVADALMLVR